MGLEVWKDIDSYEGLYQISNKGRVKSLKRVVICRNGRKMPIRERILRNNTDRAGYEYVGLSNGSMMYVKVHRLVSGAFLENPEGLKQVNHKNGVKNDNSLENLEWVSSNYNQWHRYHVLKKQKGVHGIPRGVNWRANRNKWRSRIKISGKEKTLGHFDVKEEAYKVYYERYTEVHGYVPWCLKEYPTH